MAKKECVGKNSVQIPLHKVDFGINLILSNVHAFIEDARLLLNHSRIAHVIGLLEFAIQELGKAELIRRQFHSEMELREKKIESGEVMHPRCVRINGFYSHDKKHKAGIKLLPKNVRKIEKWIFEPLAEGGFASEDVKISESERRADLYVDWRNEDWVLPSPTMNKDFPPSPKLLAKLTTLVDAIENATCCFYQK